MSRALIVLGSPAARAAAAALIDKAPPMTRVEFKGARRTIAQNDRMWSMLTDISRQKEHGGRRYTPD